VPNPRDITTANYLDRTSRHKVHGVTVAIVTDNNDPEKFYRVKVRYPWLSNGGQEGGEQTYWARIATVGAGKDRGIFFLPEVEDEVLVAFEHGDIQHPYVIGALWNKSAAVYENNDAWGGANNKRTFKSRSGHFLEFDDTGGGEKITLKTQGGHILEMDDASKTCLLKTSGGDYAKMEDASKITLMTQGDMLIDVANTLTIKATDIDMKSSASTKTTAGSTWDGKAGSAFTLKAGSTGNVESGATMTIKGSIVNIN
jgi:uncharacterized protein involved in type VI secretion and phage assembly